MYVGMKVTYQMVAAKEQRRTRVVYYSYIIGYERSVIYASCIQLKKLAEFHSALEKTMTCIHERWLVYEACI